MDGQREKISENHDNARDQSYSEKFISIKFHDTVTSERLFGSTQLVILKIERETTELRQSLDSITMVLTTWALILTPLEFSEKRNM